MPSPAFTSFVADWAIDKNGVKPLFLTIRDCLKGLKNVTLDYKGRPGVSHSLRARHSAQKNRDLFALVDVIDDDSEARWLSICFYADLVTDPEGRGDVVPGGLLGEDACCFDIDSPGDREKYILERIHEASVNAAKGK